MDFTGDGREKFKDLTRQLAVEGNAEPAPALRDHPRRDRLEPDGRLQRLPRQDRRRNGARRGDYSQDGRPSPPRSTPAPCRSARGHQPEAGLGDPGRGVAEPGADRRGRRPRAGDPLPGRLLPLPRRDRGPGADRLRDLLYAIIVLVPITLTLPRIAGIILTIGVAADASVVIFERIREEARAGKTPRAAILAGYKKGLSAIIDANVVTFATAAILFLFASAGVKGFAFLLLIGVLSLFGGRGHPRSRQRAGRDPLPARRPLHGPQPAGDPLEDGRLRRQVEAVDGDLVRADRHRHHLHRRQRPQPRARLRAARGWRPCSAARHRGRRAPGHPGARPAGHRSRPPARRSTGGGSTASRSRQNPSARPAPGAAPRPRRGVRARGRRASSRWTPSGPCWESRSSAMRSGRSCSASR